MAPTEVPGTREVIAVETVELAAAGGAKMAVITRLLEESACSTSPSPT